MTNFFDPARRRIVDRPCWLQQARVLPALSLSPVEGSLGEYELELLLNGSWASAKIWAHDVQRFLMAWAASPESCIESWFGWAPPVDASPGKPQAESLDEVLVEAEDGGEVQVVLLGEDLD